MPQTLNLSNPPMTSSPLHLQIDDPEGKLARKAEDTYSAQSIADKNCIIGKFKYAERWWVCTGVTYSNEGYDEIRAQELVPLKDNSAAIFRSNSDGNNRIFSSVPGNAQIVYYRNQKWVITPSTLTIVRPNNTPYLSRLQSYQKSLKKRNQPITGLSEFVARLFRS